MQNPVNQIQPTNQNFSIEDDLFFSNLRIEEFRRLDSTNHCYLDYTGGNLYPESLLEQHFDYLKNAVYGNPHSGNPSSKLSTEYVEEARTEVINFFNAQDYFCIFTANASAALQIVGECYPFNSESRFLLSADNHNSVNGIREYCKNKSGKVTYSLLNFEDLKLNTEMLEDELNNPSSGQNLFAFPAQSNVSGVQHSLDWIEYAQTRGWDVLLDAAAFVPSNKLDLQVHKPDFVTLSFYKIFGYPTGIGCLLVRKDKFNKLKKPWFAGGTVTAVAVLYQGYFLANNHERFENGTVDYLNIPAVSFGLQFINTIGIDRINKRLKALSAYLIANLKNIKHNNDMPVTRLFGPKDMQSKGATFILNFTDVNGVVYPYRQVEELANKENISLRTGCFCNPGLDEINSCITTESLGRYFTTRDSGNEHDMIPFLGKMRGAVRISLGLATNKADLDRFIAFVKGFENKLIMENG